MYLINMNSMLITGTSRKFFFFQVKKKKFRDVQVMVNVKNKSVLCFNIATMNSKF